MKIICGGQTGVDRAALDVAIKRGLEWGGWCPKDGWAEDLTEPPGVLAIYPHLKETPLPNPYSAPSGTFVTARQHSSSWTPGGCPRRSERGGPMNGHASTASQNSWLPSMIRQQLKTPLPG